MATYKLEEDPKVFITPHYYNNKFVYRMENIEGETNRKTIRQIDLRKDKLMVYGTEIKEPMLQKLLETLIVRPENGIVYINCDGACYFYINASKGTYRPINNAIYDWSRFGVVVPSSIDEPFRKKFVDEEEMNRSKSQTSSSEAELSSSRARFEATKSEVEEFKRQLRSSNSELQATKGLLEVSEKRELEQKNEIVALRKELEEMENKLRSVQDQLSSVDSELQSTKSQLESSNRNFKEAENQLLDSRKELEEKAAELQKEHEELSRLQTKPKSIFKIFLGWFQKS